MNNTLRHVATLAKERMKSGYFKEISEPNCARLSETAMPEPEFFTRDSDADPVFRSKVKFIMDSREEIFNPMKILLEHNAEYESADYAARQKIILETSSRYHKVREQIERERRTVRPVR